MKFTVHGKDGVTLAAEEHFEKALSSMKSIDAAEKILRVEDGALLATKSRSGRAKPLPASVLS